MPKLGPTGEFPQGKISPDDSGAIRLAIGHLGGKVVMDFGAPVAWIGFDPQTAKNLAASLLNHAVMAEAERQ